MEQRIQRVFGAQQTQKYILRQTSLHQRIAKLKLLRESIKKHEDKIYVALQKDLQKSTFESAVTELYFVYAELDFALKNLRKWLRPARVGKTWSSFFVKNRIYHEPKGVCLVIAPWNYPFQLTMSPLISAIAAGNCVMVKPSEISIATSKVIDELISSTFDENEVACFEGDASLSTALLALPFDHIFFTGSTAIGKVVMAAASKNLSSVTLELGGKSPTIIDTGVNLKNAAEKIAWGKLVNCGQTCIAPDHVFIPAHHVDEFIDHYKSAAIRMYFKDEQQINPTVYGKIIDIKHYRRLKALVDDAVDQGGRIDWGGQADEKAQVIYPVILTDVPAHALVMNEEIFGPILPIVAYQNLADVIDQINEKSKPLALYIFSNSKKNINHVLKNTTAGGTCVNDVLVHISNPHLPFGGVKGSGMGSSHGFFGFKTFSHERAVAFQRRPDLNRLIYPPYIGKDWVLRLLRKIM